MTDDSPLHRAAYYCEWKRLCRLLRQGAVDPNLPPEIVRHVVSFWLHAGYYDEGAETVDEGKYDSLIADITLKVAETASLKGTRARRRVAKLSKALEADLEESDDDWTACS
jgi:hypothetical protein